ASITGTISATRITGGASRWVPATGFSAPRPPWKKRAVPAPPQRSAWARTRPELFRRHLVHPAGRFRARRERLQCSRTCGRNRILRDLNGGLDAFQQTALRQPVCDMAKAIGCDGDAAGRGIQRALQYDLFSVVQVCRPPPAEQLTREPHIRSRFARV